MKKVCEHCGGVLNIPASAEGRPSYIKKRKFCSVECQGEALSKYYAIRRTKICKCCRQEFLAKRWRQKFCDMVCFNKWLWSRTSIRKKRLLLWQDPEYRRSHSGENAPNWQGGISERNHLIRNSMEFKQWSYDVKERDGFRCQICGSVVSGRFESHHVLSFSMYPKYRFDTDNGVCLCAICHQRLEQGLRREDVLFIKLNGFLGWRIFAKISICNF